jgi:hypothetical protein
MKLTEASIVAFGHASHTVAAHPAHGKTPPGHLKPAPELRWSHGMLELRLIQTIKSMLW